MQNKYDTSAVQEQKYSLNKMNTDFTKIMIRSSSCIHVLNKVMANNY